MSIPADDANTGLSDADAIAALMGNMSPAKGTPPADDAEDEDDEELEDVDQEDLEDDQEPEDDEDAEEDEEEDEEDDGQQAAAPEVADDTVLKLVVNGEEQEVTVGSLKRLAGQEAALTQKSQEADLVGQRAAMTIQGSLELVLEDLAAYDGVDWVLEGTRMDPEEFEWHRQQYSKLQARQDKLIGAAQNLEQTMSARREQQLKAQAVEAVQVLSDPTTGIPGWNDELYDNILSFAVSQGLPEDEVATIVNPNVIKIINDARLYREGQKATAKKVDLTPRRTRKGGGREPIQAPEAKVQKNLERKLRSGTATDDDAMAALMGRWGIKRR